MNLTIDTTKILAEKTFKLSSQLHHEQIANFSLRNENEELRHMLKARQRFNRVLSTLCLISVISTCLVAMLR